MRGRDDGIAPTPQRALVQPMRLARADARSRRSLVEGYRRYDERLRRAAEELGLHAPRVITTNPLVAGFAPFAWASTVTYFGRDDWLSSEARRAYWPAYRAAYRQMREAEVGVVAVSEQIIERIAPLGPHAVVPNGVEPAEWAGPVPDAPEWLAAIPGPRAIYVGTIDTRLDTEGVAALAASRPECEHRPARTGAGCRLHPPPPRHPERARAPGRGQVRARRRSAQQPGERFWRTGERR